MEKLSKDAKIKGTLGCSHHLVAEYEGLREVSKTAESQRWCSAEQTAAS